MAGCAIGTGHGQFAGQGVASLERLYVAVAVVQGVAPVAIGIDAEVAVVAIRHVALLPEHRFALVGIADVELAAHRLYGGHIAVAVTVFGNSATVGVALILANSDVGRIVGAHDGDSHSALGAIHGLDHKGLDLGLALTQVLHLAVVDVVSPSTAFGDGQAAQCAHARGTVAGHELGLIGAIHVGDAQGTGLGQSRVGLIFDHAASVGAGNNGRVVDRRNSPGYAAGGTVQAICDGVFKRDVAIEIRSRREDQLALAQGDGTIADRYRAAFGNGLAVDGGNGEAIAIHIRVVAKHIDGDGAVLRHGELVVARQRRGIHHAVVGSLGRSVAHRVGQGGIYRDGAIDWQIRSGDGQGDLGTADIISRQYSAGVGHTITVPVHIEAIASLGIPWQSDNDTHPSFTLVRGDNIICPIQDFDLWSGGSGTVNVTVVGSGTCIPRRIGDTGRDGIRALGQGGDYIDSESAVWIDYRGKGLLITIRIGDQQGHDTASRSICGTGQSWGGVIGVIRSRYSDHRRHKVDQLIVGPRQGIGDNAGIDGIGRIKPSLGDGGITYAVDGDKAAVATGASNTTDAATASSRCATRGRGFKSLGRVSAVQNGLLQCIDIARSAGRAVLC